MRPKRSLKRKARYSLAIVLKFLFLLGMGVETILDGIYWLGACLIGHLPLQCVFRLLRRMRDAFDEWLKARSVIFAFVTIGVLLAALGLLDIYKADLLLRGEITRLTLVSIADKLTFLAALKHLWHVYDERLLVYPKVRLIYDRCVTIKASALASVRSSRWFKEAMLTKARVRENWSRYSMVALARRAAGNHHCCLLV